MDCRSEGKRPCCLFWPRRESFMAAAPTRSGPMPHRVPIRQQTGVGGHLASQVFQLQRTVETDPPVAVLAVTHWVSVAMACFDERPLFFRGRRKSRAVREGFIWQMQADICRASRPADDRETREIGHPLVALRMGGAGGSLPWLQSRLARGELGKHRPVGTPPRGAESGAEGARCRPGGCETGPPQDSRRGSAVILGGDGR